MGFDISLTQRIYALAGTSVWFERFFIFGARYLVFLLFAMIAGWIMYALTGEQRLDAFKVLIGASFFSWLTTLLLEFVINRQRPYETFNYEPLVRNIVETPSFPSGHATLAFAMATAAFLLNETLGWIALGLAAVVAISRVGAGVHYVSDILAGTFVGITISWLIYRSIFV